MKEKLKIIICVSILLIISVINLYNAKYLNTFYEHYYLKQLIWYIIGVIISFGIIKFKLNRFNRYSNYLYYINLLLLILVLFISKPINGAKAWLDFGFFSFQPSEFMKLSLTLYLINIVNSNYPKKKKIIKMTILTLLPSFFVFLEPDTGAIIFYLVIYLTNLSFLKIKPKYYIILFFIALFMSISIVYLYLYKRDLLIKIFGTSIFYRADRFIHFKNGNYQRDLAMMSIFGSNIIRNGFKNILIYIPEGTTDFIYAFTAGNYGLIMTFIIIITYLIMLLGLLDLTKKSHKKTNYLIISFVIMTFIQMLINILMNIGLIPIIGITLPFLSYGGSSLLISFIYLALILTSMDN